MKKRVQTFVAVFLCVCLLLPSIAAAAATTEYIFYPDFNSTTYVQSPAIFVTGQTPLSTGTDGWLYNPHGGASQLTAAESFGVVSNPDLENDRMLGVNLVGSNHVAYHAFDEKVSSGVYTLSFDFNIKRQTGESGSYNMCFMNSAGVKATSTQILICGDGMVKFGQYQVSPAKVTTQNRWYRVTAIYDFTQKSATCYVYETLAEYEAAVANGAGVTMPINLAAGATFDGIMLSGMDSGASAVLSLDNWRMFAGTQESDTPPLISNERYPTVTTYLFNETFRTDTYGYGEYIFDMGAGNGTSNGWIKSNAVLSDAEYFCVTEHSKAADDLVGAMYLTDLYNTVDRLFPTTVYKGVGVKLTVSFDFMLTPQEGAAATDFYRISLLNGTIRRDSTDLRVYADGAITFNSDGRRVEHPPEDQTEWHRLTAVYNMETLKADYYMDDQFVATGNTFAMDDNGAIGVRINGPASAMGELQIDNFRAFLGDIDDETDPPPLADNSVSLPSFDGYKKPYADTALAKDTDYTFDYTFAWTTDPQNLVKLRPQLHIHTIQWLADNQEALNLKYVMNTGDLVDESHVEKQWKDSDTAQDLLDNAGIPNGVLAGNHDTSNGTYARYKEYYGEDRYNQNEWYGGSYQDNFGHYDRISVDGTDFLFVYMSYQHDYQNNGDLVSDQIAWMNEVLAAHPHHNAVLLFHDYMEYARNLGRSDIGDRLFAEVVYPNENVFMVLCGHALGTWRQDTVIGDRTVHEILFNYQAMEIPGGNAVEGRYNRDMWGMIRLMQMDVANNKIHFRTFSPINDSVTVYDTVSTPAPRDRDHFTIDFQFGPKTDTTDKTALRAAVETAVSEEEQLRYPIARVNEYRTALQAAIAVLQDESALQETVDAAYMRLQEAASAMTAVLLGDADKNNSINSTDARLTLQFAVGKISETQLDLPAADADRNGEINSTDARLILQHAVGKIAQF